MNKPLKIAYLSSETPLNKRVWSGTHHNIYKSLQSFGEVEILGPHEPKLAVLLGKIRHKLSQVLFGKRYDYRHSFLLSKSYASYFTKKLNECDVDLIVAPAASCEIASLNTKIPIVYITDGTFASCLNYHKSLTNLSKSSTNEGNAIEQAAISKSSAVIVSSDWAANSVIQDYNANVDKVKVIPFGANFDLLPEKEELIFDQQKVFKLLFVGVYWQSKGGDIAYNAFDILHKKGYAVSLTVVGCEPPPNLMNPDLHYYQFIDKNSSEGQKQLSAIYKEHHLLLLPTRFDCTPIVINEASAFGIPSMVSNSGGVQGHLKENINGKLIDYKDQGEFFAKEIEQLILHPETYLALRKSSRNLYDSNLNWKNWQTEFRKVIANIKGLS